MNQSTTLSEVTLRNIFQIHVEKLVELIAFDRVRIPNTNSVAIEYPPSPLPPPRIRVPAVYFLIGRGLVRYVGQSIHLHVRIVDHLKSDKMFDQVLFLPSTGSELSHLEDYWIDRLKPEYCSRRSILFASRRARRFSIKDATFASFAF